MLTSCSLLSEITTFVNLEEVNKILQTHYISDPLWDGKGCGPTETACCTAPGLPWFHRDYGNTTTTDYIELRVCGDGGIADEDAPVSFYEIYVQ